MAILEEYITQGTVPEAELVEAEELELEEAVSPDGQLKILRESVVKTEVPVTPQDDVPAEQKTHYPNPEAAARQLKDLQLIVEARKGDLQAMDALIRSYTGFVRLKASSYFIAGGESDDVIQEGLLGLYKAVRDYDFEKETTFRSFAELCVTRQLITAIKTATRFKHSPLNTYVSFSHTPAGQDAEGDVTLGGALPGPAAMEPPVVVISTEELQALVFSLGTGLSSLESDALRLYLEGSSYEDMADELSCDTKSIDNALQRVKRKIITHQKAREVLL